MIKKIALTSALLAALAGSAFAQGTTAPATTDNAPAASAPATPAPAPQATAPAAAPAGDLASADDCLKSAFDLATQAEQKKLSNEELDKLEDLLTKMEGHCDADQLKEASVVGSDIKTMIDAK